MYRLGHLCFSHFMNFFMKSFVDIESYPKDVCRSSNNSFLKYFIKFSPEILPYIIIYRTFVDVSNKFLFFFISFHFEKFCYMSFSNKDFFLQQLFFQFKLAILAVRLTKDHLGIEVNTWVPASFGLFYEKFFFFLLA